jgi:DNA-binding MarR family transcriptional regulator
MINSEFMSSAEKRPIPDGRMRIIHLLTERQKEALRALRPEGLLILNLYEIETAQAETWIEYWFDETLITEDGLRALINRVLIDNQEREG